MAVAQLPNRPEMKSDDCCCGWPFCLTRDFGRTGESPTSLALDAPDGAARLVYSEADGLSGLIVDRYARWLCVQVTGLGMAFAACCRDAASCVASAKVSGITRTSVRSAPATAVSSTG